MTAGWHQVPRGRLGWSLGIHVASSARAAATGNAVILCSLVQVLSSTGAPCWEWDQNRGDAEDDKQISQGIP